MRKKAIEKIGDGLILVIAETKKKNDVEYFHYKEAYILKEIDPVRFLAHSKYDIRLGAFHSGTRAGKPHDHGSAFRVQARSLPLLFKTRKRIL